MGRKLPYAATSVMLDTTNFSMYYAIRVHKGGKPVYVVSDGRLLVFTDIDAAEAEAAAITKRLREATP